MLRRIMVVSLRIAILIAALTGGALLYAQEETGAWYEIDASVLNPSVTGGEVQRRTPRETVRNFIQLTEDEQFAEAAQYLNLGDLPADSRNDDGAQLAHQLALVIERQLWIDWAGLSARPDAMLETGTSKNALAGKPRRDIGLKLVEVDGQAYEIRLGRYKAPDADPVWMFTPQTVQNIPTLYRKFGPSRFEAHIPDHLNTRVGGLRLWEWVLLPIMLGGLLGMGWAVNRIVGWAGRTVPGPLLR